MIKDYKRISWEYWAYEYFKFCFWSLLYFLGFALSILLDVYNLIFVIVGFVILLTVTILGLEDA